MAKYRPGTANNNVINLFERGKDPEQKLWTSVLGKALEDALRGSDLREAEFSINWIASQGSDCRCQTSTPDSAHPSLFATSGP